MDFRYKIIHKKEEGKMKIRKCKKRSVFSCIVIMFMAITMIVTPTKGFAADNSFEIDEGALPSGQKVVAKTSWKLAPGITETELITNTSAGDHQNMEYISESDTKNSNVKIVAGYKDYDTSKWGLQSTTKQAAAYEKAHPGEKVVAAVNGDYFNMGTGEPMGALVMNGKKIKDPNGRAYFAILKDGTPVIREGAIGSDVQEAVSGNTVLIKDGKNVNNSSDQRYYTRNAIGIKADGTVVTFTTHGMNAPTSHGRIMPELTQMMLALGCVDAMQLDDGGSATLATRPEGSDKLMVRNFPSDGAEREVSSTILIVSTAKPTGVFDHAVVTPNNKTYTPGTEVQFAAKGADSSGAAVDLPADLKWSLNADSADMGTIDEKTGKFTAGEKTGNVNVELKQGDAVVGQTNIEIAVPDQIAFLSDEVSLGFGEATDLGIIVRYQGRDIIYKPGDLEWSMTDEKLGKFENDIFISSDGESLNGDITAVSKWDKSISGKIHVIVGMLPTQVWDFEDHKTIDGETGEVTEVIPASDYYIGNETKPGILTHSNYNRGGKESIEIASIDNEEPVRFGAHSLKINYDFTNCGAVTEGACVGTTEGMQIPGTPTGIGVWVYAPKGTGIVYEGPGSQAGFWFKAYVKDGANMTREANFTLEPKVCVDDKGNWNKVQPGVYWEGWMYCEADLREFAPPYNIPAGQTFRLMYVAGINMGTKSAGSIYLDNFQFVYGANMDDIDNPLIDSVKANNVELEDGAIINTNKVTFDGMFHDAEGKYATGIDKSTIRMYLDGVNVVDNENFQYAADPDGTQNHLYDVNLLNGKHSITITVRDGFGNETSETRYFTVEGDVASEVPTVTVEPKEDSAVLGDTVNLEVRASNAASVDEVTASLVLDNQFKDFEVIPSGNYEITKEDFIKFSRTLNISAKRKSGLASLFASSDDENLIATVKVHVPVTLNEEASFDYSVKALSYIVEGKAYTFSDKDKTLPVAAPYKISAEPVIVGEDAVISVMTADNKPGAGVTLYYEGDTTEKLGVTETDGTLKTNRFSEKAGKYVIYAKDDEGKVSFRYTIGSYDAQGDIDVPYGIITNATANPTSKKQVSWLTNPKNAGEQYLEYTISGTENWKKIPAEVLKKTFSKNGNSIVAVNQVMISGLDDNTLYDFRVGDGNNMSDINTFKTGKVKNTTSFFVLGDIQADDLTNINALIAQIKEKNYDYGIQTGDAVDDATDYSGWLEVLDLFGVKNFPGTDMIHVLGNHEYAGDATGAVASAMFGLPVTGAGSYYSVTYGNIYNAVINYTGNGAQLKEALEWLEKDAASSDAFWKILTLHQPPYYTNITGGNEEVHAMVPPAAERAGIDFVFSGHDHSYARTEPLLNGEVDQNGIVYYICGSSGEKSYEIKDNKDFHFAKLDDDYTGIYLGVNATSTKMTVNVYETDGSIIDTYSKSRDDSCDKGHIAVRDKNGKIRCEVCGEGLYEYSGFAKDSETGKEMYFIGGEFQTGWQQHGDDVYYFDSNGFKQKVVLETDKKTTCTVRGYKLYVCSTAPASEKEYKVRYVKPSGHDYDDKRVCTKCGWKEVSLDECTITLTQERYDYTGNPVKPYVRVEYKGKKIEGSYEYKITDYDNNVKIGRVSAKIVPITKYIGDTVNHKGTLAPGDSATVYYTIAPAQPKNFEAITKATSLKLSWDKSLGADGFKVYKYNGSKGYTLFKTITNQETTYCNVSGLKPETSYRFRISSYADTKNGQFRSNYNYVKANTKSYLAAGVENTDLKASSNLDSNGIDVSWNKEPGYKMDYYEVYRSTSKTFGTTPYFKTKYGSSTKYENTGNLKADTTYYYRVRGARKIDGKTYYSKWSNITSTNFDSNKRKIIGGVKTTDIDAWSKHGPNCIIVGWNKEPGYKMDYYQIYKSTTKSFGTKPLYTTKYGTTKSINNKTSLIDGKRYYYKVRGVRVIDGTKYYSKWSDVTTRRYDKDTARIVYGVVNTNIDASSMLADDGIRISWKKYSNYRVDYYEVYKSDSKKFGTKPFYTTKYGTTRSVKNKTGLDSGNTYYYKVRGVRTIGGYKYYTKWSDITYRTIK